MLGPLLAASISIATPSDQQSEAMCFKNGVAIRYYTIGEGAPVVLLHGWLSDASFWGADANGKPKLKAAKGFKLIVPDLRGHGASSKLYRKSDYGANMAKDVLNVMDHVKIDHVQIVGYSMGAFIAAKAVTMQPNRFKSVVFGGQAPILASRKNKGFAEADALTRALTSENGLADYIIAITPEGQPKPPVASAKAAADIMFRGKDAKALAVCGQGFGGLEVRERDLKKYSGPVLFIYGANESPYIKSVVAASRQVLPQASVVEVPGGNHMTTLSKPEFGANLVSFLNQHK